MLFHELTALLVARDLNTPRRPEQLLRPIDFLYRGLAHDPRAIAVEAGDDRLTYAQLVSEVEALAAALQSLDPRPGSRVGICAYNTREHLTALLATYAADKVWVPLNPRNGRAELDAMVGATRPAVLVADESCLEKFTPTDAPVLIGKTERVTTAINTVGSLVRRFAGRRPAEPNRSPEDIQVIKFSGGSTGKPKGVLQSLRCIKAQAASIQRAFEFTRSDVNLIAAPLTHGTSCFVLPIFAAGGRQVLLEKPTPAAMLDAFASRKVTTLYVPPTLIYMMLAEPGLAGRQFPSLRHLIYSAASMPPDRIRAAREALGPVIETAYGQVEAPQIVTAMRATDFADQRNLTSVGPATVLTRVEIMNPEGTLLPRGEMGEVVVRGDLVMSGYLDLPELTARTIVDGWLHTGDLGVLDDRGYLYLKGRLREMIITGGFNVFPADVEAILSRHPAVAECCVFGAEDPKWGEAVHAAVRVSPSAHITEAELIQFVKSELDSVKAPKKIHFVTELPRNPVGKVSRRDVRDLVLGAGQGA
ncbi:MAG: AMP-binding protein [Gemmatimonadetes bacterium]|nr:AMP-binding protein [Gemmatimonadota bacterium]